MNDTHDAAPGIHRPRERHWTDLRRSDDTLVGGVGRGVADYFGIDPVLVRVAFVASSLIGLSGLFAYLGLWLFLPTASGQPSYAARWFALGDHEPTGRRIGLIGTGLLTLLAFAGGVGSPWHTFGWIIWIALPAVGVWWLIVVLSRGDTAPAATPPASAQAATPPAAYPPAPATAAPPSDTMTLPPGEPEAAQSSDGGDPGDSPPVDVPPPTPPAPPGDPRLTLVTLCLALIVCGGLGIWHAAGGPIEAATYAAATLGVIGIGLLIGSVFGDGRGLIGWGVLAAGTLVVAAVGPWNGVGQIDERPSSIGGLASSYSLAVGEIRLDLTDLDPDDLAGHRIEVRNQAGNVEIIVPADTVVDFEGRTGAGDIWAFDRKNSGLAVQLTHRDSGSEALELDVRVGAGQIKVRNP